MASNRYGIIKHGSIRDCKLKFPSPQARQDFAKKFSEYHASHDHDGDPPTYENVNASVVARVGLTVHAIDDVTIDGWATYEIEEYHEDKDRTYVSYEPPTCCVAPTLSLGDKTFIPSDAFQRHELSAIFGDMPDPDYTSLLESVERDGFIENVIKLLDGEILDGWHRYRAAKELNLLRKLRFQVWNADENRDGDPKAFVLARNVERRHLGASQRGQIAVAFNERFGHGGDRSNASNGVLKTKKELAEQANVGTSTIDRAIAVEKAGQSEAVIAGEKTASEVLKEREANKLRKQKKQAVKSLWDTRLQVATDYTGDADSDLNMHFTLPELEKAFAKHNPASADAFESVMRRTSCQTFKIALDKVLESDVSLETLATERIAMAEYANDICDFQRADGWILPLIEAKKAKAAETELDTSQTTKEEADEMKQEYPTLENFDKPEPEPQQEPDHEQIQQEHTQRLKELPGEIRKVIPVWQEELCIEGAITLKLLLNARCQLEFQRERGPDPFFKEEMEDVLQLMLSNNEAFGGKVCELLDTDNIEPSDPLQYLQKAHDLMWMAFEDEGIADEVSRDDFIKAACLAHPYWGVDVFPDLQGSDIPQIWEARFELLTSQIRLGSTWLKELIRANESETPVEPEPEETEVVDLKQQLAEIFSRNGFPNGVVGSIQIAWGTADKDYCAMFGQHPNPNARAISEIPEALLIALVELAATGKFHVYGNGVEPIIFERATRAKEDA